VPFKSEKQRRYLWANEPEIARDWSDTYGSRIQKNTGGISQLVKSGPGRPGYAGPAGGASALGNYGEDSSGGKTANEMGGGYQGPGRDDRHPSEKYGTTVTPTTGGPPGGGNPEMFYNPDYDADPGSKKTTIPKPKHWYDNFRDKGYQFGINRHFVNALKKMGAFGKPGFRGFANEFISGMGPVPEWAEDMSEEEIVSALTTGPYLSQQTSKGAVNAFTRGKDELSRVFEARDMLSKGKMNQDEYNKLFPNPTLNIDRDGPQEEWQRLGYPSYEAYMAAMNRSGGGGGGGTEEEETDWRTEQWNFDPTYPYPDYKDGGRIPAAFGGIMDTATGRKGYFLGSVGDAIGDAVGSVAKAAKKVLGSDVGKAAMIGLGAYYMPGFGIKATGGFGNMFKPSGFFGKSLLKKGAKDWALSNLSAGKIIGGMATLPFLGIGTEAKQDKLAGMTERGGGLIDPITGKESTPQEMRTTLNNAIEAAGTDETALAQIKDAYPYLNLGQYFHYQSYGVKDGGRIGAQEGGLMDLGGMEKDYRNNGGFVPIGGEERADDVPARLSRNEFVFTADAVRGAGGGDIDKGAEIMENVMKNLEQGGKISEETQGNAGAEQMFSVSERIGEVI